MRCPTRDAAGHHRSGLYINGIVDFDHYPLAGLIGTQWQNSKPQVSGIAPNTKVLARTAG